MKKKNVLLVISCALLSVFLLTACMGSSYRHGGNTLKLNGDKTVVTITTASGETYENNLIRESGGWKSATFDGHSYGLIIKENSVDVKAYGPAGDVLGINGRYQ